MDGLKKEYAELMDEFLVMGYHYGYLSVKTCFIIMSEIYGDEFIEYLDKMEQELKND